GDFLGDFWRDFWRDFGVSPVPVAYLSQVWRGCPLRLFTVALLEDNSERLRRLLEAVVRRRGLPAQVHVVELHDGAVSDYTYERTLMMEQRSQMLRQLRRAQ
ncbi:S12A6 protein, partial [Nesospiza acunhae]|nr:S12A6 protein [Nesospiza acunhae]